MDKIKEKMQIEVLYDPNLLVSKKESEDYTMNTLNLLLNVNSELITSGDPNLFEPDFLINHEYGIEITRAAQLTKKESIIGDIKSNKYNPSDFSLDNENAILNAIDEKINKHYSYSNVKLAIQLVVPDFSV